MTAKKPLIRKFLFLRKHIDIAKLAFGVFQEPYKDHKTIGAKTLIEYARKELKFSIKTAPCDIFWSLRSVFNQYREHYIEGKPIAEMKL